MSSAKEERVETAEERELRLAEAERERQLVHEARRVNLAEYRRRHPNFSSGELTPASIRKLEGRWGTRKNGRRYRKR